MKSEAEQLETIYEVVREYLEQYPHLRDNDEKLIATIWRQELGGSDFCATINGNELLHIFAQGGTLSSSESITRARRKLQEIHMHLRGQKYLKRFTHQQQVKEFIHKSKY